jgi:outer membrane protein TolC
MKMKRTKIIILIVAVMALPGGCIPLPAQTTDALVASTDVALTTEVPLTLDEASRRMQETNRTLQIADRTVAKARSARQQALASWWPTLRSEGGYLAMENDVGVHFTLLDHTFSFPVIRKNLADVSLFVTWPVFTGGKRLQADKMARRGIELARLQRQGTEATLQTTLVTAYYGLALQRRLTQVRQLSLTALQRHYHDASQLERQGMLTPTECLYARLARDEAEREWESGRRQEEVAAQALATLIGEADTTALNPVSPFFVADELPPAEVWRAFLAEGNIGLQSLRQQRQLAADRLRLARSDYLPTVALFGRQSVYAYHLPKQLLPHSMVGIGFSWTLFDGLGREAGVRSAALDGPILQLTQAQAEDDLRIAVNRCFSTLQTAHADILSWQTAVQLGGDLYRMRRQAFAEGMATSVEVVDAEVGWARTRVALWAACYEYVVALATLCELTGQSARFWEYAKSGKIVEAL